MPSSTCINTIWLFAQKIYAEHLNRPGMCCDIDQMHSLHTYLDGIWNISFCPCLICVGISPWALPHLMDGWMDGLLNIGAHLYLVSVSALKNGNWVKLFDCGFGENNVDDLFHFICSVWVNQKIWHSYATVLCFIFFCWCFKQI